MKMNFVIPFIFAGFLSGCSSIKYHKIIDDAFESKKLDKTDNITFFGEAEPPLPTKEEIEDLEIGVDRNNNGIRDDIDIYINRTFKDYNLVMAARQFARSYENFYRKQVEWEQLKIEADKEKAINTSSKILEELILKLNGLGVSVNKDAGLMTQAQTCVEYITLPLNDKHLTMKSIWKVADLTSFPEKRRELFSKRIKGISILSSSKFKFNERYKDCDFQIKDLDSMLNFYINESKRKN